MMNSNGKTTHGYKCIAMACQGGGALGAYHVGSLQAMQEAGYYPDVVAGISIGAFTAAIIAGNEPKERVSMLQQFWDTISWPDTPPISDELGVFKKCHNLMSTVQAIMFGQPSFFRPWGLPTFLQPSGSPAATSYYDTSMMVDTLMKFVDFQRINDKKTRLILGATRVRDGSARWFDNAKEEIGPHHVMASGAIPPGFPGVRINNELYWDGGCYSNTPLAGMYDLLSDKDTLCFVLDLFGANGREPQNMAEVNLAVKDIEFSNRITRQINNVSDRHNFAHLLRHIVELHPNVLSNHPHRAELEKMMSDRRFDFMHVLYQKPTYEGAACDCEFSKTSISDRRQQGYSDMKKALGEQEQLITTQSAWRGPATQGSVVNTFAKGMCTGTSFLRGQMTRGNPKMPEPTEIPKPTSPQPRNKQKKRIPALV